MDKRQSFSAAGSIGINSTIVARKVFLMTLTSTASSEISIFEAKVAKGCMSIVCSSNMAELTVRERLDKLVHGSSIGGKSDLFQGKFSVKLYSEHKISLYSKPSKPICNAKMSPLIRASYSALLLEKRIRA